MCELMYLVTSEFEINNSAHSSYLWHIFFLQNFKPPRLKKKLDGNYTIMLRAILNKSWWQHPTRHQLYCHLPPITKTILVRRTRHAGHCWRSKDDLISDVLVWTPAYGQAKAGTYRQLCEDMGNSSEDLPEAMDDGEKWRERESGISVLAARHDDDDICSKI